MDLSRSLLEALSREKISSRPVSGQNGKALICTGKELPGAV